ncbi:NUC173-domain-containing protein [Rozella allomycis CSF55]|uniref:NUC173-domain-containing protein n=1 Tax=Rozella allomycis (strain CSF55) TaxID=988480 RepID=A0A075B3R9_ROZAC|nr:putative NUC173 domain-containing protein [Rozella allomycis CSF55]RKP21722.1 NUC173-domain-containing protein [Rozella allomycis CSF55]|eukprot:EPZ35543.1 putative NUC173 domain-containing protein [Rozella allomycis CSF55]
MQQVFAKLRNLEISNQKKTSAILSAIEQTIKSKGMEPQPVAYFASIMVLLQQDDAMDDAETAYGAVYLLSLVIPECSNGLIRSKCKELWQLFVKLMDQHNHHTALIKTIMTSVESILRVQESNAWGKNSVASEMFLKMVSMCMETRPKLRKKAVEVVEHVIKNPAPPLTVHPVLPYFYSFVEKIFCGINKANVEQTLHNLCWIGVCVGVFGEREMMGLLDMAFKFNGQVNHASFSLLLYQNVLGVFEKSFYGEEFECKMLQRMLECRPNVSDSVVVPFWLKTVQSFAENCGCFDKAFVPMFESLLNYFETDEIETVKQSGEIVCLMIRRMNNEQFDKIRDFILGNIQSLFTWKYQSAHEVFLFIVDECTRKINREESHCLVSLLELFIQLHDDNGFSFKKTLEDTLKSFVKCMGIELFVRVAPLNLKPGESQPRAWLLSIFKDNLANERLMYFNDNLLPLADDLNKFSIELKKQGKEMDSKVYKTVSIQVWSLFESFCNECCDISESFPVIAKTLGKELNEQIYLRDFIYNGLICLLKQEKCKIELKKFSKNFLPLLFNIAMTENNQTLLECIKHYLSICENELINQYLKIMVKKVVSVENEKEQGMIMDLILTIVPFCDQEGSTILYKVAMNFINKNESFDLIKKKSYRILIGLIDNVSSGAKKFRMNLFLEMAQNLMKEEDLKHFPTILTECMLGVKEVNEKTRQISFQVIVAMGNLIKENKWIPMSEFIKMILAGLGGETPFMISASILSLSRVFYEFHDLVEIEIVKNTLEMIFCLGGAKNKEINRSLLSFIKVCIVSFPKDLIEENLKPILEILENLLKDQKLKVKHLFERLLRYFSFEKLIENLSEEAQKVLINVKKAKERRRKNSSKQKDEIENEIEDSDQDLPEMLNKMNVKNSNFDSLTFEEDEEDPLDFLNDRIISKSKSVPSKKKIQENLETDPNGKLIFESENESDNEGLENLFLKSKTGESFTKNASGKIKFNKKRSMDSDDEDEKSLKKPKSNERSETASKYKASRADGDVKRKNDKFEPYAYIPLNQKAAGKRNATKHQSKLSSIVKKNSKRK